MDGPAVFVRGDLDFDVPRIVEVLLQEQAAVPERGDRHPPRRVEGRFEFLGIPRDLHADAASSGRRLHEDRIADPLRDWQAILDPRDDPLAAWRHRDAEGSDEFACGSFPSHRAHRGGRGTDEDDPGLLASLREGGVLREESVARMDRVRGGLDRGVDDLADVQVCFGELLPSERDRLVGIPDERRVRIRVGIDGDGRDGQFAARPHDPHGDLTAVRDEDPVEHPSAERASSLKSFSEVRPQEKTS